MLDSWKDRSTLKALLDTTHANINIIAALGKAAAECLDHHTKPQPHLAALIAYYPSTLPNPKAKFPTQLNLLCHLAGTQNVGTAFTSYTYPGAKPGFAESDLPEHDKVAASLAWTRTLTVLRKAFKLEVNLEKVREEHIQLQYSLKNAAKTLGNMVSEGAYVTNVPAMTGGVGQKDLFLYYRDYFTTPSSLRMKLVSRTMGTDRVVDEMVVSFKHDEEVPWMLPGVPPTGKNVRVAMVSVLGVSGGRVHHEHLYWDQASVLVQIGLLDPKLVPNSMKGKGLKQLPVYGAEAASKVLDEESYPSNELIPGWNDRPKGDPGVMPSRPKQTNGT